MRFLIDTHVLVCAAVEPDRLPASCRDWLTDRDNQPVVSALSGYEIELKRERDVVLSRLPADLIVLATTMSFEWSDITPAHAIAAGRLPLHHRDPWDRLLVAQALQEGLPIMTVDRKFEAYGVPVLWG